MANIDYKVGDVVEYRPFGGGIRRVEVTNKDADVKNGLPGFDGELVDAGDQEWRGVWGYDDQIIRVVRRA